MKLWEDSNSNSSSESDYTSDNNQKYLQSGYQKDNTFYDSNEEYTIEKGYYLILFNLI